MEDDSVEEPTSAAYLARMLQFGDSVFPIGGFAFSTGLESAIQKGVVVDAITLREFVRTAVDQAARGDGIALVAAHAANSLAAAAFAIVGSILAVLTAHLFGAESDLITGGLLGFSPVLTAIALGTVFYQPSWRAVVYTALATVFTVIVQSALNVALTPFAIPALTAPFVLVTWLFLLPRQRLEAVPAKTPDIEKRTTVA